MSDDEQHNTIFLKPRVATPEADDAADPALEHSGKLVCLDVSLLNAVPDNNEYWFEPGEQSIGRGDECTVHIDSSEVSRVHARVITYSDRWVIEDAGSRNGTRVNDARIGGKTVLSAGDMVYLGQVPFRFDVVDAAVAGTAESAPAPEAEAAAEETEEEFSIDFPEPPPPPTPSMEIEEEITLELPDEFPEPAPAAAVQEEVALELPEAIPDPPPPPPPEPVVEAPEAAAPEPPPPPPPPPEPVVEAPKAATPEPPPPPPPPPEPVVETPKAAAPEPPPSPPPPTEPVVEAPKAAAPEPPPPEPPGAGPDADPDTEPGLALDALPPRATAPSPTESLPKADAAMLREQVPQLVTLLLEHAREGDAAAARVCLEFLIHQEQRLPRELAAGGAMGVMVKKILAGMTQGELPPRQALDALQAIATARDLLSKPAQTS